MVALHQRIFECSKEWKHKNAETDSLGFISQAVLDGRLHFISCRRW
jgi:hypothetical protein